MLKPLASALQSVLSSLAPRLPAASLLITAIACTTRTQSH